MIVLTPALRTYDWGTHRDIPELLGMEASAQPVAEAWWGVHPLGPARLADDPSRTLDGLVADDAASTLGPDVAERWGTLPYLVKVLSIHKPLSIQVHPNAQQAREGFAREDALGVERDAPHRLFKDSSHKPEMVLALTPMVVLDGFRPFDQTIADLHALGSVADGLASQVEHQAEYGGYIREALGGTLDDSILERILSVADSDQASASMLAAARALQAHPGDPGALVALAMNAVALEPGTAMFVGAGMVHSYQSGMGVEVMANSDNVVRAGLTSKPVDVELLLALAVTDPSAPARVVPQDRGVARVFQPPVDEFEVLLVSGGAVDVPANPRIVVAIEGTAEIVGTRDRLTLEQGQAAFVPFADGTISVASQHSAVVATVA